MLPTDTPGIYNDVDHDVYLADPTVEGSLSASGMKLLLTCPALFDWRRTHPEPGKRVFDVGTVVHTRLLGTGRDVHRLEFDSWRGNAVNAEADQARAAGLIPLLGKDVDLVDGCVAAVRAHDLASRLLDPAHGVAEQTLVWRDSRTGVLCRARPDFTRRVPGMRPVIVDVKTARAADPDGFSRNAAGLGYHVQDAHYSDGLATLEGVDPLFVFVVVQTEPPFLVSVNQWDVDSRAVGARRRARAVDTYIECRETGVWPAYPGLNQISLPRWSFYEEN